MRNAIGNTDCVKPSDLNEYINEIQKEYHCHWHDNKLDTIIKYNKLLRETCTKCLDTINKSEEKINTILLAQGQNNNVMEQLRKTLQKIREENAGKLIENNITLQKIQMKMQELNYLLQDINATTGVTLTDMNRHNLDGSKCHSLGECHCLHVFLHFYSFCFLFWKLRAIIKSSQVA